MIYICIERERGIEMLYIHKHTSAQHTTPREGEGGREEGREKEKERERES